MRLIEAIDDVDQLKAINRALVKRVESAMDQQGNAFSLFQTAIGLEGQVRRRTDELTVTLRNLERTNTALSVAKEASEEADRSKTRFLAAASHDVLQPLNAAILSISALAELQTSDQGAQLVRQVERSLETMNEVLVTLLDISKLDAGVVRPSFGTVPLRPLFESLRSDFGPIAEQKGLQLRFHVSDAVVRSDRAMLRRILQNLVSNALRYTRRGGVVVGAVAREGEVEIQVADTGRGIPPDQFGRIFDEFHRGLAEEGSAGLGLGLSIVRRMVAALGHDIRFTSREGRGTRFRVTAPRLGSATMPAARLGAATMPGPAEWAAAPVHAQPKGLSGRLVLLIENDAAVMEAMQARLASWGCRVLTATGLAEARQALEDAGLPDMVIADQQLDHGELGTRVVREILPEGHDVPVLIVTADGTQGTLDCARAAGFELMLKPVKPAPLRALMMHVLEPGPAGRRG